MIDNRNVIETDVGKIVIISPECAHARIPAMCCYALPDQVFIPVWCSRDIKKFLSY